MPLLPTRRRARRARGAATSAVAALALVVLLAGQVSAAGWGPASTSRVTVRPPGTQSSGGAVTATAVSASGRYVAFVSAAPDLVAGDRNGKADAFVRDRASGSTVRVAVPRTGLRPGWVAVPVTVSITPDGQVVVVGYEVRGCDESVEQSDIEQCHGFVLSRWATQQGAAGRGLATDVSDDGRYVLATATDWYSGSHVVLWDSSADAVVEVFGEGDGGPSSNRSGSLSGDARCVTFSSGFELDPADANPGADAYLHDRSTSTTTLLSTDVGGGSADGPSGVPSVSADCSTAAFTSVATDLVPGDTNRRTDAFARDLATGVVERLSVSTQGVQANAHAGRPLLSADGRYAVFASAATGLVPADTNGVGDVFVRDRATGTTLRGSVGPGGRQLDGASGSGQLSDDGLHLVLGSAATNVVNGDTNGRPDVFARDRVPPG